MPHPRLSGQEIDRRGFDLYENRIRSCVEVSQNVGKIIVIDVETGDYEIDDNPMTATDRALAKRPGAALLALRIGCDAVETFGGGSIRVKG